MAPKKCLKNKNPRHNNFEYGHSNHLGKCHFKCHTYNILDIHYETVHNCACGQSFLNIKAHHKCQLGGGKGPSYIGPKAEDIDQSVFKETAYSARGSVLVFVYKVPPPPICIVVELVEQIFKPLEKLVTQLYLVMSRVYVLVWNS